MKERKKLWKEKLKKLEKNSKNNRKEKKNCTKKRI